MAGDRSRFDDNGQHSLLGASNADGKTPVVIYADPATHALLISGALSISGSAIPASAATTAVTVQIVDGSGNQITSFGGGTQYTDGGVPPTHPIGATVEWSDGSNWQTVSTAKPLPVSLASVPSHAVTNAGTFAVQASQGTAAAVSAGWPVIGGELADTTGTFTNATQTTSVTTNSFDGYSTIIVSVNGTYGTATAVFEISDDGGTTWYSVNAARSDGTAIETGYTSLTNITRMWTLSVSGADEFRVRSTAVASGTVNVRISVESMPTPEAASVSAYQSTAANLNATVVGTGTFVAQATLQTQTDTVMVGGVNVKEINAVTPLMGNGVTGTGSQRVTIASDNTAFAVNATLSAETTKVIGTINIAAAQTLATVTTVGTVTAVTAISNALPAGTNLLGKVGIDQTTLGTTNNVSVSASTGAGTSALIKDDTAFGDGVTTGLLSATTRLYNGTNYDRWRASVGATGAAAVVDTPATSGGLSIITGSIAGTATAIKASAGQLYGYHLFNTTAAVAYVQIFNVASGSVTVGTTAPTISIGIPASGGVTVNFDKGIAFATAISFACTTTRAGASGATCDVNFFYK